MVHSNLAIPQELLPLAGRIIDTDHDEYTLYEVTILTDSTKDSQTRVLRELARHLDWFVDLSEGGIK